MPQFFGCHLTTSKRAKPPALLTETASSGNDPNLTYIYPFGMIAKTMPNQHIIGINAIIAKN